LIRGLLMYRWNSGWEERLLDLARRSKTRHMLEFINGKRNYPKANHMEWAFRGLLNQHNYFMITSWLLDIERKIEERTRGALSKSDALYPSRRFEYPWTFIRLPQRRCRILDAGGGPGPLQYLLSMLNMEVVNVDINKDYLDEVEQLKEVFEEFRNIKTVIGDFNQLDYPDNYFDATVCVSAVEHGGHDRIVDAVNEFRRVTRGPIMLTLDVSMEQRHHPECVDMNTFKTMADYLGFLIQPLPMDPISMITHDGHNFAIACVYLHGEDI